jgi:hypothetical protein
MRVNIVCYEDVNDWILGKISRKLCENLIALGVDAEITKKPNERSDINHHVIYYGYDGAKATTDTVMVTHIDEPWKVKKLHDQLRNAEMGICMSSSTVDQLSRQGLRRDRLCFVNLAHDGIMVPRKIAIGITSRVYPTGVKREWLVDRLGQVISPRDFVFRIMGAGWEKIVERMRQRGIEVDYWDTFNPDIYRSLMQGLDYYLYTGLDEGSMGHIDALAAGVATIVTPQGHHLDAEGGITYAFTNFEELQRIFSEIAEIRNARIRSVESWTWPEYARKHLRIWKYLLGRKLNQEMETSELADLGVVSRTSTLPAKCRYAVSWYRYAIWRGRRAVRRRLRLD